MSTVSEFTHSEIKALKELAKTHPAKWWKNYPLLVSILAFLLALIVSILSTYSAHQKDVHDQISELATATRTMQELSFKQVEVRDKYKGTPDEYRIAGLINTQVLQTIKMAAAIALNLGTNAPSSTVLPISQGLYGYGEHRTAEQIAELALKSALSVIDEAAALRLLGVIKIQNGSASSLLEGERLFVRATTIDQKYDLTGNPALLSLLKVMAQLDWADALARQKCEDARAHLSEAIKILNSSPRNVDLDRMRGRAQSQMKFGISGAASCLPAPDTPKLL